jgi:tight adherence protein B
MNLATLSPLVEGGVGACALALLIAVFLVVSPVRTRLPAQRRRPPTDSGPGALSEATGTATALIDKLLHMRGGVVPWQAGLTKAGMRIRVQDFALLVFAASLVAGAVGMLLSGPLLGLGLAASAPVVAKIGLNLKASRRRSAFADQLDDSLQLIASSLRAGHSLLQSLAAVAREAEEPTREEFARILNESRVGREVGAALDEAAVRMASADFVWVTQAIAINREVGGNLAEVLDGVGNTIRERNQIRRQVKALSAEGKLSAYVLMALPIGVVAFLSITNPAYIGKFTQSVLGYFLVGVCVLMLAVGALWLRKVVSFKF